MGLTQNEAKVKSEGQEQKVNFDAAEFAQALDKKTLEVKGTATVQSATLLRKARFARVIRKLGLSGNLVSGKSLLLSPFAMGSPFSLAEVRL